MPISYLVDILDGLYNFFIAAFIILFLRCFYDSGFQWNGKKTILLSFVVILYGLNSVFSPPDIKDLLAIIPAVAFAIIPIYDYQGRKMTGFLRYRCFWWLCNIIVSLISLIVQFYILPDFTLESNEINEIDCLFKFIFGILFFGTMFVLVYFGVYKRGIMISCGKKHTILMIVYSLVLFVFFGELTYYEKNAQESLTILASAFILLTTMLPIFAYSLQISVHYQQLTKVQETYMQTELEHFRQYMHAQEETRRFRHDIRNNLLCMNEMVASGDQEKLTQYLKDLLKITDTLSFKYVSGDDLLDSILNAKAQYMEQQSIRFELDGVLAGGLPWKPMDICAVFANAIDNAIEACQKVPPEERYISMCIKATPQFWLITIENSVAEAVDTKKLFQKNGGYTSKSDSSRHGIGTYSMKRTIESYGAIMEAKCTEQIFTLEIMIDKTITTK